MKKLFSRRVLCLLIICTMVISGIPVYSVKADTTCYTKVTSLGEITDGDYILYGENESIRVRLDLR